MRATTLERVEAFLPDRSVPIEHLGDSLGLHKYVVRMFRNIHGFDRVHDDPALDLFGLVAAAGERVVRELPDPGVIRYLLFAHTVLDVTPSHIDAADVLRQALGLAADVEAFGVSHQHCASGLAAIDIAGELLRADGDPAARALVLTGEKPVTARFRVVNNTTILGEASTACLVSAGGDGDIMRSYATKTQVLFSDGVYLADDRVQEFHDNYTPFLIETVERAVERAGVTLDDITLLVPHNVSRLLWLRTLEELKFDRSRVYFDNIPRYSHCCCADPFLNYTTLRREGRLVHGGLYLLTSVGMGATYSAMVVEHTGEGS
ncbi:3-oxoacyl-[acyl-carrier-protein] synthase III C-terminal domain-containing protein [Actinocrispum sp. NPDC049592]|uniref:3-oxoacyl-[acyl-carrier-protein] synthase III C-terminal domain-containing protein n=1 Tax=Actinocrispum sp. NPDC049592 TaxID=3154835 RepID=UPI003424ECF9